MVSFIPTLVTSMACMCSFKIHGPSRVYNAALDALAHEPQTWASWRPACAACNVFGSNLGLPILDGYVWLVLTLFSLNSLVFDVFNFDP